MAPQVLDRQIFKNYSYKCDIWSFGVVAYEILTGKLPWVIKSHNIKELFQEIKEQCLAGVKFPENLEISKEVKDMIAGCLKFEESERYDWKRLFSHEAFKNQKKLFDDDFSAE